jgi:hypothetical protein
MSSPMRALGISSLSEFTTLLSPPLSKSFAERTRFTPSISARREPTATWEIGLPDI